MLQGASAPCPSVDWGRRHGALPAASCLSRHVGVAAVSWVCASIAPDPQTRLRHCPKLEHRGPVAVCSGRCPVHPDGAARRQSGYGAHCPAGLGSARPSRAGGPRLTQRAHSLLSPGAVGSRFAPRPHARASRSQIASDSGPGPMRPRRSRPRRSSVARQSSFGSVGSCNGFWFLTRIWHCLHHDWIPACHRDPFPPQYEFKLLYESLNWAQRASVLQLKTAEVTTGDENTHDFRDALRRPHCREKDANGRALRTVMKAFGGKMARPAPCPAVPRARGRCSPVAVLFQVRLCWRSGIRDIRETRSRLARAR